ncbi:hypothetical protein MAL1_00183 [Bacteriophage DSS3_MAL1]|nr:hypothetical protein MAL1_00183 [Bacteriophage DSS3_MAL1]
MGRTIRNWTAEKVDDTPVAEHRYRWDREDDLDPTPGAMPIREFRAAAPYQPGDVVYVQRGDGAKKARVMLVLVNYDRWGDRCHAYRVQLETKAGLWSKNWIITYPGFIQRGYQQAGLAPEMPEDA